MSLDKVAKEAEYRRTQLQYIHQAIQENTNKHKEWRQDDKTQKCPSDLRLVDPRLEKQRIEDTKGGLFPGASNWILDHHDFQQWRNRDDVSLLWIKGDPGKGKTMLLITIINELEQSPDCSDAVLSYFFCQGTNKVLNSDTAVLRGLIYLLGVRHPPLVSHIREDYDHAGSKLFNDEDSFFALSRVLERMFRDESLTRTYLVVDALDECIAHRERQRTGRFSSMKVYHVGCILLSLPLWNRRRTCIASRSLPPLPSGSRTIQSSISSQQSTLRSSSARSSVSPDT